MWIFELNLPEEIASLTAVKSAKRRFSLTDAGHNGVGPYAYAR